MAYGGQKGFETRKMYTNKRKLDGKVSSCRYVCANKGHRKPDKRDHLTKCPRAETRTNCQVRIRLITDKKKGNFKVAHLFLEHKLRRRATASSTMRLVRGGGETSANANAIPPGE